MRANIQYSVLLLSLASIAMPAHSAYKCIDEKGNITYQTKACPTDTSQTKTKVTSRKPAEPENAVAKQKEFTSSEPLDSSQAMPIRHKLASAISSLMPIRIMMTDYYTTNGSWPTQLSDLGFNQDEMTSSTVDSVIIGGSGDFMAELNSTFGDNKRIAFSPKSVMGGTSLEWTCFTNFTSELLTTAGHQICESSENPEISAATPNTKVNSKDGSKEFLRPGEKKMLDKYEERGRKLREAKKRSVEEYTREQEQEESPTPPSISPVEVPPPYTF